MLAVAVALGWVVRESKMRAELDETKAACLSQANRTTLWWMRAGALEHGLTANGFKVHWNLKASIVSVEFKNE